MKSLRDFFYESMNDEQAEMDFVNESFNTTLYTYFLENEEEYNDNEPSDTEQVVGEIKDIMSDGSLKYVQKASKVDAILRKHIKMGKNWNMRAMKDEQGNIFLALRQTKESRRPFNQISQVTFSRLALTGTGEGGIWVYGGDDRDIWDDERKDVVEKVLKLLDATRTLNSDGFEYSMGDGKGKEEKKEQPKKEEPKKEGNEKE